MKTYKLGLLFSWGLMTSLCQGSPSETELSLRITRHLVIGNTTGFQLTCAKSGFKCDLQRLANGNIIMQRQINKSEATRIAKDFTDSVERATPKHLRSSLLTWKVRLGDREVAGTVSNEDMQAKHTSPPAGLSAYLSVEASFVAAFAKK